MLMEREVDCPVDGVATLEGLSLPCLEPLRRFLCLALAVMCQTVAMLFTSMTCCTNYTAIYINQTLVN